MKENDNFTCEVTHLDDGQCLIQKMTAKETLEGMAALFQCLADPSRLKIINALLISEMCVHSVSKMMDMSQPAVSHHLKQLKLMRLVKCRREGKSIFYSLNDYHIQLLFDLCKTHIGEQDHN